MQTTEAVSAPGRRLLRRRDVCRRRRRRSSRSGTLGRGIFRGSTLSPAFAAAPARRVAGGVGRPFFQQLLKPLVLRGRQDGIDPLTHVRHLGLRLRGQRFPELAHPLLTLVEDRIDLFLLLLGKVKLGSHSTNEIHPLSAPRRGRTTRDERGLRFLGGARVKPSRQPAGGGASQKDDNCGEYGLPRSHQEPPGLSMAA